MTQETIFDLQARRNKIAAELAEIDNQIRNRQNQLLQEHARAKEAWLKSLDNARNVRQLFI